METGCHLVDGEFGSFLVRYAIENWCWVGEDPLYGAGPGELPGTRVALDLDRVVGIRLGAPVVAPGERTEEVQTVVLLVRYQSRRAEHAERVLS